MGISEVNVNLSYSILAPSASNTDTYNQDIDKCSKQLHHAVLASYRNILWLDLIHEWTINSKACNMLGTELV